MPDTERRLKRASKLTPRSLPVGLDSALIAVQYTNKQVDPARFVAALAKLPGFQARSDKAAARGVFSRGAVLKSGHAHLEARHLKREGKLVVELELLAGPHGRGAEKALPLNLGIKHALQSLGDAKTTRQIVVSGIFTFDLKQWEPTVPLPFSPPGLVDKIPGLPQISGLEFSFSERTDQQPLHRAAIVTYPKIGRMTVRLFLFISSQFAAELPGQGLDSLQTQVAVFARRREGGGSNE